MYVFSKEYQEKDNMEPSNVRHQMHLPQAIAQNLTAIVTLALFHED
jgi:hypothetical protein